jgi:hypothetical protein
LLLGYSVYLISPAELVLQTHANTKDRKELRYHRYEDLRQQVVSSEGHRITKELSNLAGLDSSFYWDQRKFDINKQIVLFYLIIYF